MTTTTTTSTAKEDRRQTCHPGLTYFHSSFFLNDAISQTQKYFWIYFWIEFWIYNLWRDEFLWGWSWSQYLLLWNASFILFLHRRRRKEIHPFKKQKSILQKAFGSGEKEARSSHPPCCTAFSQSECLEEIIFLWQWPGDDNANFNISLICKAHPH